MRNTTGKLTRIMRTTTVHVVIKRNGKLRDEPMPTRPTDAPNTPTPMQTTTI